MPKNSTLLVLFLKMKGTSIVMTLSLASILTVALFSTVPNEVSAQPVPFDYRCYTTTNAVPDTNDLLLFDQFFPTQPSTHTISTSEEFCNPANKSPPSPEGTPPAGFIPHLRCWNIDDPNPIVGQTVIVRDQFFTDKRHVIGAAVEFCHTVFKDPGELSGESGQFPYSGSDQAQPIQNWKCYTITEDTIPPLQPFRLLEDQFTQANHPSFPRGIEIGEAILLCTPATKTHQSETFESELTSHLKCYDIIKEGTVLFPPGQPIDSSGLSDVTPFTTETLGVFDQFEDEPDTEGINELDKLCTQATKEVIIAGTFLPIDSMVLILAGAQMSAAWILPALVATAGVGYGIEIARKYHKNTK